MIIEQRDYHAHAGKLNEVAPDPVLGKRTVSQVDPADAEKPKLQSVRVSLEPKP